MFFQVQRVLAAVAAVPAGAALVVEGAVVAAHWNVDVVVAVVVDVRFTICVGQIIAKDAETFEGWFDVSENKCFI